MASSNHSPAIVHIFATLSTQLRSLLAHSCSRDTQTAITYFKYYGGILSLSTAMTLTTGEQRRDKGQEYRYGLWLGHHHLLTSQDR